MDRTSASAPAPRAPEPLRWDVETIEIHNCTLATASAGARDVVLRFGERRSRGENGEVGAALARTLALSPLTARNLATTLRRLLDDIDGGAR